MNKLPEPSDLVIDFSSPSNTYRRIHGGGKGQPIARAVGLKTYGLPLSVIDATAGLGQDAFVLACLGCKVTMIERNPLLATLLSTALHSGAQVPAIAHIIARMQLINGNAISLLQQLADGDDSILERPDIVYLDPMFPERNKSALVKKEMRVLKQLVGMDEDADLLLAIACKVAKRRIVVKRPKNAGFLCGVQPHASQIGSAGRFDLYMGIP